jgi:hypothetical protein
MSMNIINALDLDPIKVKLMHKESGEGWSLERANAVEFEYRRFLTLMKKYPHEQTSPLVDVDTFWHYHILDTMKYAADCEAVFGYFLHHFPYVGMRGEEDEAALARIGQRMKELYEAEFGEDYVRPAKRAFEGATQANAFCGSPEMQANAFCGSPEKQVNAFCGSPEKQANAFCGSPEKQANAFCGSPEKQANAFCGSPEMQANAFCGSPEKQANAFCGSPEKQANAFCGSPEKQANAFCGSPEKQANAFCGSPEEKVAFCGSPEKAVSAKVPNQPGLFSGRPSLS